MSWNEQGEITRIEGILTIAFFISVCSHRDRKQLYLIIKIPYSVNMPIENKDFGLKKIIRDVDLNEYAEWAVKVPILEQRIKELEAENKRLIKTHVELEDKLLNELEKLKKDNQRLKIISGEAKSGWIQERDLLSRPHPTTGDPDGYRCPFDFKFGLVEYLDIYYSYEKKEKWCSFYHPYPQLNSSTRKFIMPHTGYLYLKGELPEQKKIGKMNINDIKDENDIKIIFNQLVEIQKGNI